MARWRREAAPRILIGIWCLLITFALVSLTNPPWLESLSRRGAAGEALSYSDRGDQLVRAGNHRAALFFYERALQADPTHVGARVNCAVAYGQIGRHDEGIRLLRDALASRTRARGLILYNLAELQRLKGDKELALAGYKDALNAGARPELVHARMADILERSGRRDAAREEYRRALAAWKDPGVQYRNMLRQAYETTSDAARVQAIEEVLGREITPADLARYDLEFLNGQIDRDPEVARIAQRIESLN
jgi:tetratricopeptide (TPR) repeat protein